MIYKNKNNLDLQKIAAILKENNIEFLLKKKRIVVKSNSIKFTVKCDQDDILFAHQTPIWFGLLFFAIISLLGSLIMWLAQGEGSFIILGGVIGGGIAHLLYKFSPRVLREKKKIMRIILNSNVN